MMAGVGSSPSVAEGNLKYDLEQRVVAIHNAANWHEVAVFGAHCWSGEGELNHAACCRPCDPHLPIVYPSIA